uniref:Uncharacterized protein n=1 Tax=Cajanus cajan TaxID=3821 RepID=A0A151T0Z0_CAJCA|nr:hypothetical protein KK1_023136 [Cajanus cajan]
MNLTPITYPMATKVCATQPKARSASPIVLPPMNLFSASPLSFSITLKVSKVSFIALSCTSPSYPKNFIMSTVCQKQVMELVTSYYLHCDSIININGNLW